LAAQLKVQEALNTAEEARQGILAAKATVAERETAYATVAKASAPDAGIPGLASMVEQIEALQRSLPGSGDAMAPLRRLPGPGAHPARPGSSKSAGTGPAA